MDTRQETNSSLVEQACERLAGLRCIDDGDWLPADERIVWLAEQVAELVHALEEEISGYLKHAVSLTG